MESTKMPHRRAGDTDTDAAVARLTELLYHGDYAAAAALLADACARGLQAMAALSRIITPAMHRIGELWEIGEVSIADEHLATAACERLIAGLYPLLLTDRPRSRQCVLVAAPEGEAHSQGPRIVADILEGCGYSVVYLGVDVPPSALADAVSRHQPALLALSLTRAAGAPALERAIDAARQAQPGLPILLGGQGLTAAWEGRGHHVCRNVEGVARQAAALLRQGPGAGAPTVPAPGSRPGLVSAGRPADPSERFAAITSDFGAMAREHALRAHEYHLLAFEDALTGLPNRRAFDAAIAGAMERGVPGFLLLIDVDDFKRINDTRGHAAGDEVLVEVARAIAGELRPADFVARVGGDEFAAVIQPPSADGMAALADRIREGVQLALSSAGVTVSIGAASIEGDAGDAAAAADRALYAAKAAGRNTVAPAGDNPSDAPSPCPAGPAPA